MLDAKESGFRKQKIRQQIPGYFKRLPATIPNGMRTRWRAHARCAPPQACGGGFMMISRCGYGMVTPFNLNASHIARSTLPRILVNPF